jgi:(2Fe-2S) ferredoxin
MKEEISPYTCHIFVCTNDRGGARKSCADGGAARISSLLKARVKERGWTGKVRISKSGCMGLCEGGPNIIIYPHKILFSHVSEEDAEVILSKIESLLSRYT